MKNEKFTLGICVVLLLTVVSIFFIMKKKEKSPPRLSENAVIDAKKDVKAIFWDNYVPYIVEDDYKQLSLKLTFKDTSNKDYTLHDILSNKFKLVVRYSYIDCDLCVGKVMSLITKINDKVSIGDIVAFTNSYSYRDFVIRAGRNKYPIKSYEINEAKLGLFMENKNFPFMFVLTPEGRVIKVFTPAREVPEQIEDYLSKTLSYINEQNRHSKI